MSVKLGLKIGWEAEVGVTYSTSPKSSPTREDFATTTNPTPSPNGEGRGEAQNILKQHYNLVSSKIMEYAKEMRSNPTSGEELMWYLLRNRNFLNLKFRRQHPVEMYILDFYCHELSLAIEIDGSIHNIPEQKTKDQIRTEFLSERKIKVYRIDNNELIANTETVLNKLAEYIETIDLAQKVIDLSNDIQPEFRTTLKAGGAG